MPVCNLKHVGVELVLEKGWSGTRTTLWHMPVSNLKHVGVELILEEAGLVVGLLCGTCLLAI